MRIDIRECAELLRGCDRILLLTHTRPDGDTVGSAAALCRTLRKLQKTAYLYPNRELTEEYAQYAEGYIAPSDYDWSCVIGVDIASRDLLPLGFTSEVDLAIDHHPSNTGYSHRTLLDETLSSCGELVLALIKELLGGIDGKTAELLYVAVSTDTGCFSYGNTTARTLYAGAELVEAGADNRRINKQLFRTASIARIRLEGLIYSSLRLYAGGLAAVAEITLDMMEQAGAGEGDCGDIASLPGRIEGVRISVTIRELEPDRCKLSVRSTAGINADEICRKFGGGGHAAAAGCSLDCGVSQARDLFLLAIEEPLSKAGLS